MRRLFLIILVVAGLALGGPWWRSPISETDLSEKLVLTRLDIPEGKIGPARFIGAWELESPDTRFGGYSALIRLDDGCFLAGSDRGSILRFSPPGTAGCRVRFGRFAQSNEFDKRLSDLESLTRDPESGRIWAGYEFTNAIVRYEPDLERFEDVYPAEMRDWADNGGPESILRLSDGRFIVISEVDAGWTENSTPGLLYPSDPVDGAQPMAFRFHRPDEFRPVDMAQLPDARVLVLMRKVIWGLPPGFASRLLVADPADIREGGEWRGEQLLEISGAVPPENYEGLSVEPLPDGSVRIWLISDDNTSQFQRSLLLQLEWNPREKARG
ncbi:hypothetical protein FHS61_001022 [Altererythrobacter atlanticus]|uniref:Uncharacterized protein n=1 Tax=Croceibacterium atlanticum TaxID=1267766 RepID=A0A0F7KVS4_9SPHN|nr:esterase-like activity of phytase family protein [Croceibacterium atlanticum]AKH43276.1 hypothetical protein WYH_02244 [Croceibacterium atlanticum]MBB5732018.1 hypothetical protein [Croceibacterium atlanticum]